MAKNASYDITQIALSQGTNTFTVTSYAEGLGESNFSNKETYTTGDIGYNLQYGLTDNGNAYLCTGRGDLELSAIEIPAYFNNLPVIGIAPSAFEGDTLIKSIAISYRLEYIGVDAFLNSGIREIIFPVGTMLKVIDDCAFEGSALESIDIPTSVTSIGQYAFHNCKNLETITFGDDLTVIYFRNTIGFSDIRYSYTLLNGNTSSGAMWFHENDGVCDIYTATIPANIRTLTFSGKQDATNTVTFQYLQFLSGSVQFGACYEPKIDGASIGVKLSDYSSKTDPDAGRRLTIYSYAFKDCTSLTKVDFTNRLYALEANVMKGCNALKEADLGERLTYVPESTFEGCSSLEDVTFGGSLTRIETNAFKNCSGLVVITMPQSLDYIGKNAFTGCNSLSSVKFLCRFGWLYTAGDAVENGTGIAGSVLFYESNAASYLKTDLTDYNWFRITKMLPPTICMSGTNTLSITDSTGLAEEFRIYVGGNKRATIHLN